MPKTIEYKIKLDKEWDEYQVALLIDGKTNINCTYYTDDRDDAELTGKAMVAKARKVMWSR